MRRVFLGLSLLCMGCFTAGNANLPVVDSVDLDTYMGRWYEIARYPNWFQKGCRKSTATYELRPDGRVEVLNECERDGDVSSATGTAWVVDPASNAKLKVSFFWPFRGDYWILELGEQYEYAVVSAPSMKYLWVLARTPELPRETMVAIEGRLEGLGFDTSNLIRSASD